MTRIEQIGDATLHLGDCLDIMRDLIAWVYGSGFPKSLDVSKAIDGPSFNRRKGLEWRFK